MALNDRMRKFARALALGEGSAAECYREAGYAPKTAKAATAAAGKLKKHPEVAAYVEALREQADKTTVMSLEDKLEWLSESIVTADKTKVCPLSAMNLLSKLDGDFAPKKVEHSVDDDLGKILEDIGNRAPAGELEDKM